MDDHALAAALAKKAGDALAGLRRRVQITGGSSWSLRDDGDQLGHDLLVEELAELRPDDIVFSEEGVEDRRRLDAARTWIVDPLDGSHDYGFFDSIEWAVHVALVEGGRWTAGAVAVPGLNRTFDTATVELAAPPPERAPMVICGRSNVYFAREVADVLDARLTACGSSGVKAMFVVDGAADVYVHASGLYEWDVCAPAAVAEAAGLVVTDIHGQPIEYNKPRPVVEGFVVARPEYADVTRHRLDQLLG